MEKFLLKNYKTAIIVVIGVVLNGLVASGYMDISWLGTANVILGFLGLGAVRLGIAGK